MRKVRDDRSGPPWTGFAPGNASGDRARPRAMHRAELAHVSQRRYRAVFKRDETGTWIASVPDLPGCHTYGRTLAQARRRLREALSVWVDDADDAELEEEIRLPKRVLAAVDRSVEARRSAAHQRDRANELTARAARTLVDDLELGLRDAADLLGLSHQRVQQLVHPGR